MSGTWSDRMTGPPSLPLHSNATPPKKETVESNLCLAEAPSRATGTVHVVERRSKSWPTLVAERKKWAKWVSKKNNQFRDSEMAYMYY